MADDKKAKKEEKPKDEKPKDGKEAAAAEGAEHAEGAEDAKGGFKKKFTPKKIILFVVLPLVLILALGAGAYFMGFLDTLLPGHGKPTCEEVKEGDPDFEKCQVEKEAAEALMPGVFLDVPNMIVNLSSTTKQPRFLKVSLKIELENAEEQKKFEPILPRVIDQFQMYLRELRIEDLRGTSGIYRMKIELLSRVRAAAPGVKVRDVLFQEILVQ